MAPDRIFPDAMAGHSAPPPPGAYYNMKDQNMPPPATYQERQRRRRSPCCCCLIWLCSVFTILAVLVGLAILIFWLVVMPKAPKFAVETVNISGLNGTSPLNTVITYEIMARNPNKKMSFYYSDIRVKVEANGEIVNQGTVDSFSQGHKNTTIIQGTLNSEGEVVDSDTLTLLSKDPTNAPFYAQVDLKVKIKVGSIKTRKMKVTVKCDTYVDLTASGNQLNSSKCKVHW